MLKKTITFEDFNGKTITEDFYFHLSKSELVELEMSEKDGLAETLKQIVVTNDGRRIIDAFKSIILAAYGIKSDDGRRFIKSEHLREEFAQTEAYSVLFIELATDAGAAAAFVNGVVPASLVPAPLPTELASGSELDPKDMTRDELLEAMKKKLEGKE